MACRCTDIANVNADLGVLAQAEGRLAGLDNAASAIEEATRTLAAAVGTAAGVSAAGVAGDVHSRGVRDARDRISSDIQKKRESLHSMLRMYQEEDKAYHAEQDRKEAEDQI